jgi:hypothetical protein
MAMNFVSVSLSSCDRCTQSLIAGKFAFGFQKSSKCVYFVESEVTPSVRVGIRGRTGAGSTMRGVVRRDGRTPRMRHAWQVCF